MKKADFDSNSCEKRIKFLLAGKFSQKRAITSRNQTKKDQTRLQFCKKSSHRSSFHKQTIKNIKRLKTYSLIKSTANKFLFVQFLSQLNVCFDASYFAQTQHMPRWIVLIYLIVHIKNNPNHFHLSTLEKTVLID